MNTYHKREWLNEEGIFSDSTITAYHGMHSWFDDVSQKRIDYLETQLKIKDCHDAIRFHVVRDDMKAFIKKIKLIAKVCNDFAEYLEEHGQA